MIFAQVLIVLASVVLLYVLIKRLPDILKVDFKQIIKTPKLNFELPKMPKLTKFIQKKKSNEKLKNNENNSIKKDSGFSIFNASMSQEDLFNEADGFFKKANFKQAEKIYLKIVASNPKNIKVYNRLGVIYMEKREYTDAKESFKMAIQLDPSKATRYYNFALACIELKEFRNAIESLEKALDIDKTNSKYKNTLKQLKEKVKYRYKEAKRLAD